MNTVLRYEISAIELFRLWSPFTSNSGVFRKSCLMLQLSYVTHCSEQVSVLLYIIIIIININPFSRTCVCPICHEQVTIDSADKANLNREIISNLNLILPEFNQYTPIFIILTETLENHAESLNLMMSAVYCNECKLLTSEESLRICNTCSAKKDSKLDISSENFDDTQVR